MVFTYLRVPRLLAFFFTSALAISAASLAAWALKKGFDHQNFVKANIPGATLHISNIVTAGAFIVAAGGVTTVLCVYLAFLTVVHPSRPETFRSVRQKEFAFGFCAVFYLASLIPATFIMATKSGVITDLSLSAVMLAEIVQASGQDLRYKSQKEIKYWVIVGWCAFFSMVVSLILVSRAARRFLAHLQNDRKATCINSVDGSSSPVDEKMGEKQIE